MKESTHINLTIKLISILLFLYFSFILIDYQYYYSPEGIATFNYLPYYGKLIAQLSGILPIPLSILLFFRVFPKAILIVLAALFVLFYKSTPFFPFGWRSVLPFFLVYISFMVPKNKSGELNVTAVANFNLTQSAFIIYKVHLSLLYLKPALYRCFRDEWIEGRAVSIMLNSELWSKFPPFYFRDFLGTLEFLHYFFWVIEFIAPILFWTRYSRYAIYLLILMHIGIEVAFDLDYWSLMMVALLLGVLKKSNASNLKHELKSLWQYIKTRKLFELEGP